MRPLRGKYIRDGRGMLWRDQAEAIKYAGARHSLFGQRQQVRTQRVLGVTFWRVSSTSRPAPGQVVEPPC